MGATEIEQRGIDVIRGLAMDAVQKAGNGHPGTAMALAPLAHVLWTRIMRYDASGTRLARSRPVRAVERPRVDAALQHAATSPGSGSSSTTSSRSASGDRARPATPSTGTPPGVEVTTGPLGPGLRQRRRHRRSPKRTCGRASAPSVVDHHVFAICGDGCLEEGVSHEAASLAGHLGLGRLVYVYDDNHITIDGPTELAYSDDVPKRFAGYGWHVVELGEVANDLDAIEAGIREGMAEAERPSIVILRSHIGYPSPKYTDTAYAHGNALGADEVAATKAILGLPPEDFFVPDDVLEYYREAGARGAGAREEWEQRLAAFRDRGARARAGVRRLPRAARSPGLGVEAPVVGGRWEGRRHPACVVQGSARRHRRRRAAARSRAAPTSAGTPAPSWSTSPVVATHQFGGRQLHFGIREHGMGSMMNGMSVSGLLPAGGTFFVFSDYMRPAVRLAALSQYKTAFVWSHDSVGVGEDGPTHQPIEHLASLRAMPELRRHPSGRRQRDRAGVAGPHRRATARPRSILSRQSVPVLASTAERAPEGLPRGAYVLVDETGDDLDLVLIGTGSEVSVCVTACEQLAADGLLGARGVDAVVGPLRRATRRVLRRGAAARRAGARRWKRARRSGGSATPTSSSGSIASARRRQALPCSTSSGSTRSTSSNVPSRCWNWRRRRVALATPLCTTRSRVDP